MAEGARDRFAATVAASVTGIAGPDGGSEAKPVGLTYVAVADAEGVEVRRHLWSGDRASNKVSSAAAVLELLLERVGATARRGLARVTEAASIGAGLAPARDPRPIRAGERIHVLGIAGAGASAAARLARWAGADVSGCDPGGPSPYTTALADDGLPMAWEHDPSHVAGPGVVPPDRLAVTKALTAIAPDHPELEAARRLGIPLEPWQQVVADAAAGRLLVGVAGTHGKSTTSGWLVHVLAEGGLDPTAFVGALLRDGIRGAVDGASRPAGRPVRRRGRRVRRQLRPVPAGARDPHVRGVGPPRRLRRRGRRRRRVRALDPAHAAGAWRRAARRRREHRRPGRRSGSRRASPTGPGRSSPSRSRTSRRAAPGATSGASRSSSRRPPVQPACCSDG